MRPDSTRFHPGRGLGMTLLLVLVYFAFISLGLPDAIFGSAWPVLHLDLHEPISDGGIMTAIVAAGTILSSLLSVSLVRRLGTGRVVVVSVLLTAVAILGIGAS